MIPNPLKIIGSKPRIDPENFWHRQYVINTRKILDQQKRDINYYNNNEINLIPKQEIKHTSFSLSFFIRKSLKQLIP